MTESTAAPAPAAPAAAAPAPAGPATASPAAEVATTPILPAAIAAPPAPAPEYKLEAPKDSGLDDKHVGAVAEWAKANKLAPEVAQAVLNRDVARVKAAQEAAITQKAEWLSDLKVHFKAAEKPGEFHDLDTRVTALVDKFAPKDFPDFRKWLTESGIVYHRALFSFLANIANAGREGSIVPAGAPTNTASAGRIAFPHPNSRYMHWTKEEAAAYDAEHGITHT